MRRKGVCLAQLEVAGFYKYCNKPSVSARLNTEYRGNMEWILALSELNIWQPLLKNAMNFTYRKWRKFLISLVIPRFLRRLCCKKILSYLVTFLLVQERDRCVDRPQHMCYNRCSHNQVVTL